MTIDSTKFVKGVSILMKKLLSILLTMTLVLSSNSKLTFAADSTLGDLYPIAEKHSSISGNAKQYTPFTVNGQRIQLFKETVLTADEAVKIYSNAYALISKSANEMGIDVSMDDPKFQEYAKTYAFFEGETDAITQEVQDFAKFIDLYENTAKNEAILQTFSTSATLAINDEDLDVMMPIMDSSTSASGEIIEDAVNTTMHARGKEK